VRHKLNIAIAVAAPPFQQWHERRIYDRPRFRELSALYGYLPSSSPSSASTCTAAPDPDAAL
jgi:carboxylate-amine ligase